METLRYFTVAIGNQKKGSVSFQKEQDLEVINFRECGSIYDKIAAGSAVNSVNITCQTLVIGRYVKIQLDGILALCEVQVHGILIPGKYK